ncbi:hypothetical protein [Streptomyces millisiae]|uniref:Uncharacterized protein n=1 Tax=Streptomyces millisiae TaxID=3075542 RepID=A0ABU2LV62_9ACTN|nr:hypothetical protein [Streptomyces sp. DSM 44918]MDT0321425.1 hypothetical protein [Streptomyces sp. DSM 44918]
MNSETLIALHAQGERRAWLRAHLAPDALHYLYPAPAPWSWPARGTERWECRILVRMRDGELVRTMLTIRPEDFMALPSSVPRLRQRLLAHMAAAVERDTGLWGRDHQCAAEGCGYTPPGHGVVASS